MFADYGESLVKFGRTWLSSLIGYRQPTGLSLFLPGHSSTLPHSCIAHSMSTYSVHGAVVGTGHKMVTDIVGLRSSKWLPYNR